MSVFSAYTEDVGLPVLTGRIEPDGTTQWVGVLNSIDRAPWIHPCDNCTVVEGRSSYQAGCTMCRERGWFDTRTGLPTKVWWWEGDAAAAANWLLHTVVPRLLSMADHDDFAEQVEALPPLTGDRLGKRLTGTGLLKRITTVLEHEAYALLPQAEDGVGRVTRAGWGDRSHPIWAVINDTRWDTRPSRLGWWACRAAHAAYDRITAGGYAAWFGDGVETEDGVFYELLGAYEYETAGLLLLETDIVLGPDLPEPLHDRGFRCESRTERDGVLYQCDISFSRTVDINHTARTPAGQRITWADEDNVDVPCTATLTTTTSDGTPVQVQCGDTRYRHQWIGRGIPSHTWMGTDPADPDGFPDVRSWTDFDDGAAVATD